MEAATLPLHANSDTTGKAWWNAPLQQYAGADLRRSLICLSTSVLPYLALWPVMYFLLQDFSYPVALPVIVLASGFLLRSYIVFHDCSHGSFMPTKRANTWLGVTVGLMVYSPHVSWRQEHAGHHASSGDIERRGVGDVETWTVSEYRNASLRGKLYYRIIRNPVI